ncbi:MAG: hypothetical protein EXX96DRAFT_567940 [Benjaminiella poitrasii]|nr:MAG: hypothetical protein EXX96DRAFT_567940 [Benjaminiella poitrasii]
MVCIRSGPSILLQRHLKRLVQERNRNHLTFITYIDEFNTSKVYPVCQTKSLYHAQDHSGDSIHSVLRCKNCAAWWNRDHMVSMNVRSVFIHMAANGNRRPSIFSRSTENRDI